MIHPRVGDLVSVYVDDYNGQGVARVYGMLRAFGDSGTCIVKPMVVFGVENGFVIEVEEPGTLTANTKDVAHIDGLEKAR